MRKIVAALLAPALLAVGAATALAQPQAQPVSPEQRLERLERQVEQVQRRLFPRGRPADTAGLAYDPAATQSAVIGLADRLNSLERQLADILRLAEENGNRLRNIEAEAARQRTEQNRRLSAIEAAMAAAPLQQPVTTGDPTPPLAARPSATVVPGPSTQPPTGAGGGPAADPGEDAYTEGFRLWQSGQHDAAIASLRAFVAAFPGHRRVSWANNLAGRAMLDKGEPRAAAEALLANYRSNPRGERAADSLYYLGQALMKLGQPGQACNAYAELESVYADTMRADLRSLLPAAKSEAGCR